MVTITAQKTTAPKNHSALDPISPRLKMMNHAMAKLPAMPQANHQTPRQPNRCASRLTGAVVGIGSAPLTSPRSESSAALVDCTSPVIPTSVHQSLRPCAFRLGNPDRAVTPVLGGGVRGTAR